MDSSEIRLRPLLLQALERKLEGDKDVAILYSGGYESFSCLCLCLELGVTPNLYTFYLEGIESYDIMKARNDAKAFGVKLTEAKVPNSYDTLVKDVRHIIEKWKVTRKTVIQCLHPLLYTIPLIGQRSVITGLERGRPWGLNQKGTTAGYKGLKEFNDYRTFAISEQAYNSIRYIVDYINEGHRSIRPYDDDAVNDWFMKRGYKELNTPHAKQPILDEFKTEIEFSKMKLKHASYQVESGIREFHDLLLKDSTLNPDGVYKSVVGVYNRLYKDILDTQLTLF